MKKIVCIGECSLNIVLAADGRPQGSMPGGRIANAAAILGRNKFNVVMASEVSDDAVGNIVVDHLTQAGVDVSSVDRYTEGRTALNVLVQSSVEAGDAMPSLTRYENYPPEAFDIVWPRIDPGDIVLYGGFYSIDGRMRPRLSRLLAYAVERKAVLVYLPGFLPQQEPRITRVMPQILDNLEMANIVITRDKDLSLLFGIDTADACYRERIDFYCRSLINIDQRSGTLTYYSGKEMSSVAISPRICSTLLWNAGVVAGVTGLLAEREISPDALEKPDAALREALLGAGAVCAADTAADLNQEWQNIS